MANLFIDKSNATSRVVEWGHEGNDTLLGGAAADDLAGAQGNDVIHGNGGSDFIHDHTYTSLIPPDLYDPIASGVTQETALTLINNNGKMPIVTWSGLHQGGNDRFFGEAGRDVLLGLFGKDTLNGGTGNDELYGDLGNDLLIGGDDNDILAGHEGDDRLMGGNGNDTLHGGADDDRLEGGAGGDLLEGGTGNDTAVYDNSFGAIHINLEYGDFALDTPRGSEVIGDRLLSIENVDGSRLDDIITGSSVDNILYGNLGNDLLIGGGGGDELDGGAGTDTVSYYTLRANDGVTVTLDDARLRTLSFATGGEATGDTLISIENLTGTDFNDRLTGNSFDNRISGLRGSDVLNGLDGRDRLTGGEGNDTLTGGNQDDFLEGGEGADLIDGGDGFDTVSFANQQRSITLQLADPGQDGRASTFDGTGIFKPLFEVDTLRNVEGVIGTAFGDRLTGGGKGEIINGGEGNDTFFFSEGSDQLDGDGGVDTLDLTGAGNAAIANLSSSFAIEGRQFTTTTLRDFENMIGSRFSDTLTGARSDNELTGGEGFDRMSGAGGNDTFIFRTIAEMGLEAGARDVITDFTRGDRLDFSDIGDALGLSLDFVGTQRFSGEAGEIRATIGGAGNTLLAIDINGDSQADARLTLLDFRGLSADDMLL